LVDTSRKNYFELKPVTWANDRAKQAKLDAQVTKYDSALQPLGYHRGRSSELTFGMSKSPLGIVRDQQNEYLVSLRPASQTLQPSGVNGRGVVWYELDELKKNEKTPRRMRIPNILAVPEQVQRQIQVLQLTPEGGPGLYEDYVFYAGVVATYISVSYALSALAAWGTTTTIEGYKLDEATGVAVGTITSLAA
jgi:hypothetical protein